MPPRIRLRPNLTRLRNPAAYPQQSAQIHASYASLATATTPAPSISQMTHSAAPILRYPPTQPPSHKPPEVRKTQLHRTYQSILRSSPLILLFQHNNLLAVEWMSIRRELSAALAKIDAGLPVEEQMGSRIKIQIIQTGIFASALRVVELFSYQPPSTDPNHPEHAPHPSDPLTQTSAQLPTTTPHFTHGLSQTAHAAATSRKKRLTIEPLLVGPVALVTFPSVSPAHLATVLSILAPSPDFPAPRRKANPEYHEPSVQVGLQKLMLLGARVEGKVFDDEGTRWVGGIEGGIGGLRAQLVGMLGGVGAGVTNVLESAGRSLYFAVEGRRMDMEKEKPKVKEEGKGEGEAEGEKKA